MQLNAYLSFPGTCEAAFEYYARHLGGTIRGFYRYAGSPMEDEVPADWGSKIMHGTVLIAGQPLMGGDVAPQHYEATKGFSLSINLTGNDGAERMFNALADGGKVLVPLEKTFWAELFGMVVDRYGIQWMINCEAPAAER